VTLAWSYALLANLAIFWAVAAQRDTPWLAWSGWLLLLLGLALVALTITGTRFSVAKLPFIDRDIYSLLPGGLRPFWNPDGFNSNLSGGLLALFWAPALVLAWAGRSWLQRDVAKIVFLLLSAVLLLMQSRGALLGAAAALVAITCLRSIHWRLFWVVAAALIIMGLYPLGPERWLETFLGRSDALGRLDLQSRQLLWQGAFQLIGDYPLTGVGLGLFEPALRQISPAELFRPGSEFKHAHNIYLQAGAELGLPGLAAYLAFYLVLLYLLARRARAYPGHYTGVLALGLFGSLVTFLSHGFFEVITYAPRAAVVVWALFGLMAAVSTGPAADNGVTAGSPGAGWDPDPL
jgi:O-antigen ligase